MQLAHIKPGDRVTFRAVTRWNGGATATRTVRSVSPDTGRLTVRYDWPDFVVRAHEVLAVNGHPVDAEERR